MVPTAFDRLRQVARKEQITKKAAVKASSDASTAALSLYTSLRVNREVCRKPGSVLQVVLTGHRPCHERSDNHLSRRSIAAALKRPTRTRPGQGLQLKAAAFLLGLAPSGVYQKTCHHVLSWSLTPRFHPCLCARMRHRRSVSVALSFSSR